jgi:hypothetical protein
MREPRRGALVTALGVVLLLAVGAAWSLASPLGSTPDEDFHLGSIWCSATARGDVCQRTGVPEDPSVERVIVPRQLLQQSMAGCFAFHPDVSASCQAITPVADPPITRANDGLYPGGYYLLMGFLVSGHITVSVLGMRLLSWVLCLGLLTGAALVAVGSTRRAFVVALLATAVPMSVYLFASVNPSGLAIAAVAAFWGAAYTFATDAVVGRRLVAAGVLAVVAALVGIGTRADAGMFLALAAGAVWLVQRGFADLRNRRSILLGAVAVGGLLAVVLGGGGSEAGSGLVDHPDREIVAVLFHNLVNLPELLAGGLGLSSLGWADIALPSIVSVTMLMVAASVVTVGLRGADPMKSRCVGLLSLALAAVAMYVLLAGRNLVNENVQPRYLVPLLEVIVGVALVRGRGATAVRFGRTHRIVLATAVSVAHAAALHTTIRRYVTGADVLGFDLDFEREWWWPHGPSPMVVWFVGSVAFAVVCAWLFLVVAAPAPTPDSSMASAPPAQALADR